MSLTPPPLPPPPPPAAVTGVAVTGEAAPVRPPSLPSPRPPSPRPRSPQPPPPSPSPPTGVGVGAAGVVSIRLKRRSIVRIHRVTITTGVAQWVHCGLYWTPPSVPMWVCVCVCVFVCNYATGLDMVWWTLFHDVPWCWCWCCLLLQSKSASLAGQSFTSSKSSLRPEPGPLFGELQPQFSGFYANFMLILC